jgi:hypothetical protein
VFAHPLSAYRRHEATKAGLPVAWTEERITVDEGGSVTATGYLQIAEKCIGVERRTNGPALPVPHNRWS